MKSQSGEIGRRRKHKFAELLRRNHHEFVYHPEPFYFSKADKRKRYQPDFYLPAQDLYIQIIGTRQRLRDDNGAFLRKIRKVEQTFGIKVLLLKPNGQPYFRHLHRGSAFSKVANLARWNKKNTTNRITRLRLKAGVSQRDLALFLKASQGAVVHWEKEGFQKMPVEKYFSMIRFLRKEYFNRKKENNLFLIKPYALNPQKQAL